MKRWLLRRLPLPEGFPGRHDSPVQGDKDQSAGGVRAARLISEKLRARSPEDAARHGQHGLILAALGQKEEAIAEGKRAVELLPESQDALDGPQATAELAQIYAWTGEFDEAFRLLDHLFAVPSNSPSRYSSSIQPGTRCATTRAIKL